MVKHVGQSKDGVKLGAKDLAEMKKLYEEMVRLSNKMMKIIARNLGFAPSEVTRVVLLNGAPDGMRFAKRVTGTKLAVLEEDHYQHSVYTFGGNGSG